MNRKSGGSTVAAGWATSSFAVAVQAASRPRAWAVVGRSIARSYQLGATPAAFGLALFAGLIAGLYPSWRICRVAPATYLKLQ